MSHNNAFKKEREIYNSSAIGHYLINKKTFFINYILKEKKI